MSKKSYLNASTVESASIRGHITNYLAHIGHLNHFLSVDIIFCAVICVGLSGIL